MKTHKKKYNHKRKPNGKRAQVRKSRKYICTPNKVTFLNSRSRLPFPPRYRCMFHTQWTYYQPAGEPNNTIYTIYLNSCYKPLNTGVNPFVTGRVYPVGISSLYPTGFRATCNGQLYQQYRVISSKLTGTFASTLEDFGITFTPSNSTANPSSYGAALAQPFTKSMVCDLNKGKQSLSAKVKVSKFYGVREQAIEDDLSGQFTGVYNANPSAPLFWLINIWEMSQADNTTGIVEMTFDLVQEVELFDNTSGFEIV